MQNPLESYRRTQRELRRQFESFTRANCPTCPTPCCRRPARLLPTDILLAESTGWKANLPVDGDTDLVSEMSGRMVNALKDPPKTGEAEPGDQPCEFLGESGCTFPTDLRPFGCTAFICRYMYARLDRPSLTRIKRLVRELEEKHQTLLRSIRNVSGFEE